jgi:tRNA threonylcarbamoyladenosine biosynthesis protein TsaB
MDMDIENMKVLVFDTSWDFGVVATVSGMKIVEKYCGRAPRAASEGLLPWIMEVTSRSGWRPGDIDLIAVGRGPGSFTGTRIAVSVAKSAAETLNIPLVSVSSVESIALTAGRPGQRVAVVMDARKGEVMAALYAVSAERAGGDDSLPACREAGVLNEPSLMTPARARQFLTSEASSEGPIVACGNGLALLPGVLSEGIAGLSIHSAWDGFLIDPLAIAALALRRLGLGERDDPAALEPVYLRGF